MSETKTMLSSSSSNRRCHHGLDYDYDTSNRKHYCHQVQTFGAWELEHVDDYCYDCRNVRPSSKLYTLYIKTQELCPRIRFLQILYDTYKSKKYTHSININLISAKDKNPDYLTCEHTIMKIIRPPNLQDDGSIILSSVSIETIKQALLSPGVHPALLKLYKLPSHLVIEGQLIRNDTIILNLLTGEIINPIENDGIMAMKNKEGHIINIALSPSFQWLVDTNANTVGAGSQDIRTLDQFYTAALTLTKREDSKVNPWLPDYIAPQPPVSILIKTTTSSSSSSSTMDTNNDNDDINVNNVTTAAVTLAHKFMYILKTIEAYSQ